MLRVTPLLAQFHPKPLIHPYKELAQEDFHFFTSHLAHNEIITGNLDQYNIDYTRKYKGSSKLVLAPSTSKSMQTILSYCNSQLLAVVPQGGNTGLVGGNVPVFDEIVLSTKNLNKILNFDEVSNILSCEAGCVLESMNQYLQKYEAEVPWDLGAKGSCQMGGNVSTNAGGKYFIKYGPLRGNILGMEVALTNGTILDLRSNIRKDNTGIDLKQLFIGAEGSLGIITSLDILCVKSDRNKVVVMVKAHSYDEILRFVEKAKKSLGKNLNAMEYMDGYAYNAVFRHLPFQCPMPIDYANHALLLEINGDHLEQLDWIPEENQSVVSNTEAEYNNLWNIRENIAEAANREGTCYKYDVSFDVQLWSQFVADIRGKMQGRKAYVMGYGHIGDGNLHINICMDKGDFDERFIFQEVVRHKGSISAEHGVGQHKAKYLSLQKQSRVVQLGRELKSVLDPRLILNPHKLYSD